MLYDLAHFIKEKCSFLWDAVEWGNSKLFSIQHKDEIEIIPNVLNGLSNYPIV